AVSRWKDYNDVEGAFKTIVPYHTTVENLQTLGFDPKVSPNVKILNYVDIIQIFMPNPGIQMKDLAPAVRDCIEARENSRAYQVELHDIVDQRHGNLFLDIFSFKRKTHESGWRFKGLILIKDNLVVYKLASGEPQVSNESKKVKPLGPLQELDFSVSQAASYVK
ncbi:MAG TPA: hypothetical protein VFF11_16295, partial [Candidatus Binatia bacterium]|nr:hypothetical protein [Candidatus Binatia bacterium]